MIQTGELDLTIEDYDKAFTEVSFLLDMFVETIEVFVGKSTPALAVAAGRKAAKNMPIHLQDSSPTAVVAEVVRFFKIQQMDIRGKVEGKDVNIELTHCPIASVCANRDMELGGSICQMFHYYLSGILAELAGFPVRPKAVVTGECCSIDFALSRG